MYETGFFILTHFLAAAFGAVVGGIGVFLANLAWTELKIRRTLKREFPEVEKLW